MVTTKCLQDNWPLLLKKQALPIQEGQQEQVSEEQEDHSLSRKEHAFFCKQCGYKIAQSIDAWEVNGSHFHVHVNPSGLSFRIRCFKRADGCLALGKASSFWSWFPGFAWQITFCLACHAHLGWLFTSEATSFYGLIADHLRES